MEHEHGCPRRHGLADECVCDLIAAHDLLARDLVIDLTESHPAPALSEP